MLAQRSRKPPRMLLRAGPVESPRRVGAEEWLRRLCGPGPKSPIQLRSTIQAPLLHGRAHVEFARFLIPAFIYFVNNNVVFLILLAVDPVTFQLLSQLKTVITQASHSAPYCQPYCQPSTGKFAGYVLMAWGELFAAPPEAPS